MRDEYGYCDIDYQYYPPEYDGPVPFNPVPPPPQPKPEPERKVGYGAEGPTRRPPLLAPIPPRIPPKHTQVQPRCFTCEHFEMCAFKQDYLKTVTLIQNCLGAPSYDYEWTTKYIVIPDFVGLPIINEDKFFPKEVVFDNSDNKGKLFLSKFNGINFVNVVYKDTKYYILIQLKYNTETELYELKSCQEAFYKVKYELNKDSLEEIQLGLMEWREIIINSPAVPPPPRKDIINTTHFSAVLDCDMYSWNRDSFDDAIKKLIKKYPNGIPIGPDGRALYHIATYHVAEWEVPYAPLIYNDTKEKRLMNYVPPQPMHVPKPPKRRGDM